MFGLREGEDGGGQDFRTRCGEEAEGDGNDLGIFVRLAGRGRVILFDIKGVCAVLKVIC